VSRVKLLIDSSLEDVPLAAVAVRALAGLAPLSDEQQGQVELCLVEAANNTVLHAYSNEAGHAVEISVHLLEDRLVLEIADTGRPMPQERLAAAASGLPELDPSALETLPEGGRGLAILHALMDSVGYRSDDGTNTLTLVKRFGRGAAR
jgi:serine/threonine-protein kinase RsbW